jgi:uncharacterized OsmC-like protein
MSERVVVYQDKDFQTGFKAADPEGAKPGELEDVGHLHQLTPYGLLLASVASCTAIVLNTFSQHHDIPLESVTVDCMFDRVFADDCKDCDENTQYEEIIKEKLSFEGDLDDKQLKQLHQVAKACSVRRMVESGIRIESN